MTGITACLLASLTLVRAPVPPEAPPDPTARGYLGITVGEGVTVDAVTPGLPAARAGLRAGDVIVRVGTLEPQTYDQEVAHVCSFRPGAVVEIVVRRGTERKTFKVKLAARPPELDYNGRIPGRPIIDEPIPQD